MSYNRNPTDTAAQASMVDDMHLSGSITEMNSTELVNMLDTGDLAAAVEITSMQGVGAAMPPGTEPQVTKSHRFPINYASQTDFLGTTDPYVSIIEQPKSRHLRFRYVCEGRSAGSIAGEKSRPEKKTSPTIKVHNYTGPLIVVVSCVTNETRPRPHPHSLVGNDCTKGVCTVKVKDRTTISFNHLGIQCARKKDVEEFLRQRKDINVDPFQTGFDHMKQSIDLNVIKLCFQVFLPDKAGQYTRILKPICSQAIFDKKAVNDLSIGRIDRVAGPARGGTEIFMLCDKVTKDDVTIQFQEIHPHSNKVMWESYGEFGAADIHKQYAIVFKSPPYEDQKIKNPVEVEIRLKRPSDGETSNPVKFCYIPEDPDEHQILAKKRRKHQIYDHLIQETQSSSQLNPDLKERIRLKASRKIKAESGDINLTVTTIPAQVAAASSTVTSGAYRQAVGGNDVYIPNDQLPQTNYDYEATHVSQWLNYDVDSASLPHPTQVTSNDGGGTQFTTLQLSDLSHFIGDSMTVTDLNEVASLTDINSGDLLQGIDPNLMSDP